MRCLISFVSVAGMSSLFFIGGDRADPMPGKTNAKAGAQIFSFFTRAHCRDTGRRDKLLPVGWPIVFANRHIDGVKLALRQRLVLGVSDCPAADFRSIHSASKL